MIVLKKAKNYEEMSKIDMLSSDDNAMAKSASGQDTQGLIVRLYEGCEFVYNKPVDLRNCEEDGLTNVITLNPRTSLVSRESTDKGFSIVENVASNTYVRFADAYDPSVYVELTFDAVSSPYTIYVWRIVSVSPLVTNVQP